jgi:hypothetical protein
MVMACYLSSVVEKLSASHKTRQKHPSVTQLVVRPTEGGDTAVLAAQGPTGKHRELRLA